MSQRVKNAVVTTDSQEIGADIQAYGENTRRVVWQGIEYIIGENEQKAFADNTVAQKLGAVVGDRIANTIDGDGVSRR